MPKKFFSKLRLSKSRQNLNSGKGGTNNSENGGDQLGYKDSTTHFNKFKNKSKLTTQSHSSETTSYSDNSSTKSTKVGGCIHKNLTWTTYYGENSSLSDDSVCQICLKMNSAGSSLEPFLTASTVREANSVIQ